MAKIEIDYVFTKKDRKDKEKYKLIDIIQRFFNENYGVDAKEGILNIEKCEVNYSIKRSSDIDRCFLTLTVNGHIRSVASGIGDVTDKLQRSGLQKYFHRVKVYDGLSEYYCEKLYPKYAEYERKLRYMVLLIVTKAYGTGVISSIDTTIQESVKNKAHKNINNISVESIFEYFELKDLENYLFLPPEVDMKVFVNEELTPQRIEELDKSEICELIEDAKHPTCLWERIFSDIGIMKEWKSAMEEVHNVRNSVAHHKTITEEEYRKTQKQLKKIRSMLDTAINETMLKEFANEKMADILGNFAVLVGRVLVSKQINYLSIGKILLAFNKKMQDIVKPIEQEFQASVVKAIKENAFKFSSVNIVNGCSEMLKNCQEEMTLRNRALINSASDFMRSSAENALKNYKMGVIEQAAKIEELSKQFNGSEENEIEKIEDECFDENDTKEE